MNLSEFLFARIAEDEAVAREWPEDRQSPPNGDALWIDALGHPIYQPRARVLAECESKRRIVDEVQAGIELAQDWQTRDKVKEANYWRLLQFLALPYADHPDYRDEWRP